MPVTAPSGPETANAPSASYRFERPRWRVVFDLLAAPLSATAFGAMFVAVVLGVVRLSFTDQLLLGGLAGFFTLLLAVATVATYRNGLRRDILGIGPEGIWTPEVGHVAWSDVAEIRRESYLSPAGNRRRGMIRRERLGIVPGLDTVVERVRQFHEVSEEGEESQLPPPSPGDHSPIKPDASSPPGLDVSFHPASRLRFHP